MTRLFEEVLDTLERIECLLDAVLAELRRDHT